jgi:hypothetical protein
MRCPNVPVTPRARHRRTVAAAASATMLTGAAHVRPPFRRRPYPFPYQTMQSQVPFFHLSLPPLPSSSLSCAGSCRAERPCYHGSRCTRVPDLPTELCPYSSPCPPQRILKTPMPSSCRAASSTTVCHQLRAESVRPPQAPGQHRRAL